MTENARPTFGHLVDVTLSEEALNEMRARELEITRERFAVEGEKAQSSNEFSDRLKKLKKEQLALLASIDARQTKTEVQCYHEKDERRGMMLTRRADDGEVVDERALTAEERKEDINERQGKLFEEDKSAPPIEGDEEQGNDADIADTLEAFKSAPEGDTAGGDAEPDSDGDDDEDGDDDADAADPDDDSAEEHAH